MSEEIKDRLKALRSALNLKQREVAERLGLDVGAIGNWEAGTRAIPSTRIYQLCKEYNVRREWLERGEGEMFERPTETDKYVMIFSEFYDSLTPKFQEVFLRVAKDKLELDRSVNRTQINNGNVVGDMIQK